jgi:hypothetical protein
MEKKLSRATVGQMAELCAANELVKNGFRVYFPHQASAEDDDLIAVNKESGNVYRIQVKSKNDTRLWSAMYFKSIKEKAHKSWFLILYERPTEKFYIVPSLQLTKLEADKNGFCDEKGEYRGKWGLLE